MSLELDAQDVADYLARHPDFFEEHGELLSRVKLANPVAGRAVSLQERQMEILRQKIKGGELRLAELIRLAEENEAITGKFLQWTRALLLARNDVDLPHTLINGMQSIFSVPAATLRLWNVAPEFAHTWFAAETSEDARIFANSLTEPFCGPNNDFEVAGWLEEASAIRSLAMIPLRVGAAPETFGLLLLGSPDPSRFSADMATDFLSRIGETASAALNSLLA